MITPEKLALFKLKLLRILDDYAGVEARQDQLATDLQLAGVPNAKPEESAAALHALADDGLARKRKDTLRGWLWRIEPEGHRAAAKIALEEGE